MCGIAGITAKIGDKEKVLKEMTRLIAHRGPDDDGFFVDQNIAIGMRRLSIIDLAGGHQPIFSHDERLVIVFNGEIYNYKELRGELTNYEYKTKSDTEVVLAAFEKWGTESFARLRGMFAFCIYDRERRRAFLVRDFFGIKPLYYLLGEGQETSFANSSDVSSGKHGQNLLNKFLAPFAFSSEIKSFFALPGWKPEVNDASVYNYLSYQYNPLEETFIKGVYKLPPAHFLEIDLDTGEWRKESYWQFEFKPNEKLEEEKTKQDVLNTMRDSVSHHMIADVPVASFLSGGIDSSIIATLMTEELSKVEGSQKVKTFTVGFGGVSEASEARETSDALGTDHKEISIGREEYFTALPKAMWHFDEPVADPSALGLYFLSREAAKEVKVVLSGEGSDEFFGGYNIYLEPYARRKITWIPRFILKFIAAMPLSFRGRNYARRASRKLEDWYIGNASIFDRGEVERIWRGSREEAISLKSLYQKVEEESDSTKMQYIDINTWLVGDILAKADKMTMAHSLELRVPFLDLEVAKLTKSLPDKLKWRGGVTKYILREAFKGVLPEGTRKRRKLGFPTSVRYWLDHESTEVYKTILENGYVKSHLDTEEIQRLIDEHVDGRRDNSRKIYLLLSLAIWYNIFIERKIP